MAARGPISILLYRRDFVLWWIYLFIIYIASRSSIDLNEQRAREKRVPWSLWVERFNHLTQRGSVCVRTCIGTGPRRESTVWSFKYRAPIQINKLIWTLAVLRNASKCFAHLATKNTTIYTPARKQQTIMRNVHLNMSRIDLIIRRIKRNLRFFSLAPSPTQNMIGSGKIQFFVYNFWVGPFGFVGSDGPSSG